MGDLQRRTEHKRSMDEAELASQQLQLSESERRAERDSRSLERTDHLPSVPERSPTRGSSGDTGGGSQGQGQLPQRTSLGSSPAPRRSHLMAWRSEAGPGGGSPGISGSVDAAEALARASMESQAGAGPGSSIRKQRSGSMTGMASGALLPVSMGSSAGAKPTPPASLALRISTYGRGVFGGGSGGTTASTAAANAGNLLLNKALESELYRNGGGGGGGMLDSPFDDASSIGGESESDFAMSGPRTGRRPPKMAHSRNPLRSGPGGMPGSKGHTGPGSIAGASAAAPPPGLTLDKLAYSDMYGTIQILSVDDEEVNQIVLEEILTSSGYHFARCMDGLEALEWLCASETMPDLILLDCMMPNMSGHEFCSTLRRVGCGAGGRRALVIAAAQEGGCCACCCASRGRMVCVVVFRALPYAGHPLAACCCASHGRSVCPRAVIASFSNRGRCETLCFVPCRTHAGHPRQRAAGHHGERQER